MAPFTKRIALRVARFFLLLFTVHRICVTFFFRTVLNAFMLNKSFGCLIKIIRLSVTALLLQKN